METEFELSINGKVVITTTDIHDYLTARSSALMALSIAGIDYDITSIRDGVSSFSYFIERVRANV